MDLGLGFEALHVRRADVRGQGAGRGRVLHAVERRRRAVRQRQLDVVVIVVEGRKVQPRPVIEQEGLEADFVGRQGFRREGQGLRRIERARVHTAALVAGRGRHIAHDVVGEVVGEVHPVVEAGALEVGALPVQARDRAVVAVGIGDVGAVAVVAEVGVVLDLVGIAHTGGEVGVAQVQGAVCVDRLGARRRLVGAVDEVEADPGKADPGVQAAALVQVEAADGVVDQAAEVAGGPELLAQRVVDLPLQQDLHPDRGGVGLL